ncbi:hypothetical protein niasHS_010064 [Heterodera schachtii]|uniref:Molybdopterin synthase catalytic subunit n=1 Tax=Heterodera schachtii TaxID=97005 RepID=A0ABD2J3V8_HETSC
MSSSAFAFGGRPLRQIFGRNCEQSAKILSLAGATCTGKTSLANSLVEELRRCGLSVRLIGQDRFYKTKENVRTLANAEDPSITFYDYDQTDALNEHLILEEIASASKDPKLDALIMEGNMLTDLDAIRWADCTVFLTIDKESCRQRRVLRTYDPPDEIGYFDQVVWPAYEQTLQKAKEFKETSTRPLAFVKADRQIPVDEIIVTVVSAITKLKRLQQIQFQHLLCDKIELRHDCLSTEVALEWVSSASCGANSLFSGTTRDSFCGKRVLELEYEAYQPMAREEIAKLCIEVRDKIDPSLLRIYIAHRIGVVPIGQISVIISVSAPQRNAAITATKWLIDELKKRVPIWKKEKYDDGTCSWKENTEQPQNGE